MTCKAGASAGTAEISFDLAWDRSWRAVWEEPEARHGGKGSLKIENWDAAWVFVKFHQPGAFNWSHATLATGAGDHQVPAGAALDVGLNEDPSTGIPSTGLGAGGAGGKRGLGVFVYRAKPGHGANDWKGVNLRWQCGADGVSAPGEAEIQVLAVGMVYVPAGAFWVGDGSTNRLPVRFGAGKTAQPYRINGEDALTLGGERAENLGNCDGIGMYRAEDFTSDTTRALPAAFPKGHKAFYCMKHKITQSEFVAFLNTVGAEQTTFLGMPAPGINIVKPGNPYPAAVVVAGKGSVARTFSPPAVPAVCATDQPQQACAWLHWSDDLGYAAWAGLRPMTELEYEKACRGPLKPVADEQAAYWGIWELGAPLTEIVVAVGNHPGRGFDGSPGNGSLKYPDGWHFLADGFGLGIRTATTSDRNTMFHVPGMRAHCAGNGFRCARTAPAGK